MAELNPATASAFEAAYKKALPDELEQATTAAKKVSATHAAMGAMGAAMPMPLLDVSATLGNFCKQWPTIKGFLLRAIWALSWVSPGPAAMARAFVKTFESTVLPVVCPKPE